MTSPARPPVSRAVWALGLAGLLPQAAAVVFLLLSRGGDGAVFLGPEVRAVALVYAAAILSFLGGVWWGFAMRRTEGQGGLAAVAVLPSLAAAALVLATLLGFGDRWPIIALGAAILLTLPVDRRLAASGEAPDGWWRLRATLSIGLGSLTIAAGLLAP